MNKPEVFVPHPITTSISEEEYDRLINIKDAALHLAQANVNGDIDAGHAKTILRLCSYCGNCGHKLLIDGQYFPEATTKPKNGDKGGGKAIKG